MTLDALRRSLISRLDEGPHGAHGWWLITRVHLSDPAKLKVLCEYIYARAGSTTISLDAADYARMATAVGVNSADPGVQLRRHHLLALVYPLRLLERPAGTWSSVQLSSAGTELAVAGDPGEILERALDLVSFCEEPWYPPSRVAAYEEFHVRPYAVARQVMAATDGWIDRDEFDLFVSRVRRPLEVRTAVSRVERFRRLSQQERQVLLNEVKARIVGAKAYSNWRDQALHTFSFFSLGTSVMRRQTRLYLASARVSTTSPAGGGPQAAVAGTELILLPHAPESQALARPPVDPAANSGAGAEMLVAKLFRAAGWRVALYASRRGYGFDLWAGKGLSAWIVEVKSSVGPMQAISLTPTEFAAARHYGTNYLLAVVEQMGQPEPKVSFVVNPGHQMQASARVSTEHVFSRAEWRAHAVSQIDV